MRLRIVRVNWLARGKSNSTFRRSSGPLVSQIIRQKTQLAISQFATAQRSGRFEAAIDVARHVASTVYYHETMVLVDLVESWSLSKCSGAAYSPSFTVWF